MSLAQQNGSIALAAVLSESVLSLQEDASPGTVASVSDDAVEYRVEVHQASGMTAMQLSIPPSEGLLRIRAFAFANNRTVAEIASDIVARRLRLPEDHQPETEM